MFALVIICLPVPPIQEIISNKSLISHVVIMINRMILNYSCLQLYNFFIFIFFPSNIHLIRTYTENGNTTTDKILIV